LAKQINAEKVAVSGQKRSQKLYRRHSGRPGGMKVETFDQLQKRIPERIVEHAVRGMLPKGRVCSHSLILSFLFPNTSSGKQN
jgi:large subunit ribosomal protein L13